MGPWKEHGSATGGYYKCNKYDDAVKKDSNLAAAENKQKAAKDELQRYMWYYERYENHNKAEALAHKLMPKIEFRITELNEKKSYPPAEL